MNKKYYRDLDGDEIAKNVVSFIQDSPIITGTLLIGGSVLALYLLSHLFKITAGTVRGWNDLQNALKGH